MMFILALKVWRVGEFELRSWYSDECGHGCLCRVCAGTANQVVLECVQIVHGKHR